MQLVKIFFSGEVIPRIIMVLDEKAGDRIIDPADKLLIHVGGEELILSEYSHYTVDEVETNAEELKLVTSISKFVDELSVSLNT